ncbi:hypothetical protein RCL1_007685 [Eukaryota sp. TZLM3-RCL]
MRFHPSVICGLEQLKHLSFLNLRHVDKCDCLNKSVRLKALCLNQVTLDVFEALCCKENLHDCQISVYYCPEKLSEHFQWILESAVIFPVNVDTSSRTLVIGKNSTSPLQNELVIDNRKTKSLNIEIQHCPYMYKLVMEAWYVPAYSIRVLGTLYLSAIILTAVDQNSILELLENTQYLVSLYSTNHSQSHPSFPKHRRFELNYLQTATMEQGSDLLKYCDMLPRLETLSLVTIDDFNFQLINSKYPMLKALQVVDCGMKGEFVEPNYTIQFLHLIVSNEQQLVIVNFFLQHLQGLKHLALSTEDLKSPETGLFIPPSVQTLNCRARFEALCNVVWHPNNLEILSGSLYTVRDNLDQARSWLKGLKQHLPKLSTMFDFKTVDGNHQHDEDESDSTMMIG